MHDRHQNRKQYFDEQGITTSKYVIPYIERSLPLTSEMRVLEIGCGEGGNMVPFLQKGCEVIGVDLNEQQIKNAKIYIDETVPNAKVQLLYKNIYDASPDELGKFDLIMLRDVIEHIHDQEQFMKYVKAFLKDNGRIFFGFPPWRMPFGGHQQVCKSKFLSKLPYFHLLPKPLYAGMLRMFGETKHVVDALLEVKETGISIARFERIARKHNYTTDNKTLFFINPNYEIKFKLTPKELFKPFQVIPYFKDFLTTCYYTVIRIDKK
jgi:SAM-dependent methyltransferase